jgi:hypothetical protein
MAPFLADFGVTAVFGSATAQVILDMPDQSILGDMQLSTEYAITYAAADLAGLKHGSAITVDGVAYTVREVTRMEDGRMVRAVLKK